MRMIGERRMREENDRKDKRGRRMIGEIREEGE